ncbi:hypothetical protein SAMN06275492_101121 [Dethiosulfovibrio salsuginis]|uniref:Ribosomal protein L7Ae n=1 Tax=Dethiosulfovibrio salsuginis TaxID=561720 RepID=A0A1X7I6J4_9BACT|nr:hypothetical protein SAMN06275492_101121 [Dethiosulfovibrio salsuginis]
MTSTNSSALFSLGLARKSGVLIAGQDRVFACLKGNKLDFVVLMASDRSDAVASTVGRVVSSRDRVIQMVDIDRYLLGRSIGLNRCQIVALPLKEGLAEAVVRQLSEGGEAVE